MVRYPDIYIPCILLTISSLILFNVNLEISFSTQAFISIGLILLLGIPHGATDFRIFKISKRLKSFGTVQFILLYISLMGLYGVIWWLAPIAALILFLLISAYHFGQSNWHVYDMSRIAKVITSMIWGAFVIGVPVIYHYDVSVNIIKAILRTTPPPLTIDQQWQIVLSLLLANSTVVIFLRVFNHLSNRDFIKELINLVILFLVFIETPLLVGFTLYFVFWHSLISAKDQIKSFKNVRKDYSIGDYIKDALPFSLAAILGVLLIVFLVSPKTLEGYVGYLFVLISLLTLPHIFLIENLIKENPISSSQ